MLLHEIPGATERPAHCAIVVRRENGATTVDIPPVRLSPLVIAGGSLLALSLLVFFATGVVLYATGKPILLLKLILHLSDKQELPRTIKQAIPFSVPVWGALLWVGAHELNAIFRPGRLQERLVFQDGGVIHRRRYLRKADVTHYLSDSVRGFLIRAEDGEGTPASLHIEGRGHSEAVGEYLRNVDREWLASVGNALLRER